MNFHDTTLSAIVATLIAAGLIALTSYAWKHRERLRGAFKKKETRKETVEIEKFIMNVQRWHSPVGISLSITQSGKLKKDFTTKFDKIVEIGFIRKATPELSMLMLKFSESSRVKERTAFVTTDDFKGCVGCSILWRCPSENCKA